MMLKVTDIVRSETGKVWVDAYIPLSFRISEYAMPAPLYWEIGLEHSLFLIKIDRDKGILSEATLVLPGPMSEINLPSGYRTSVTIEGLPVIDVALLQVGNGLVSKPFHMVTEQANLYVLFDHTQNPDSCIRSGRVGFFTYESRLVGVGFLGLSNDELSVLNEAVRISSMD